MGLGVSAFAEGPPPSPPVLADVLVLPVLDDVPPVPGEVLPVLDDVPPVPPGAAGAVVPCARREDGDGSQRERQGAYAKH